jgi:predicted dehydrogenase
MPRPRSPRAPPGRSASPAPTADWRDLLADPTIDLIDITAPNALHHEMAMAAIAAGKHVYCEKPLAPALPQAREMAEAATQQPA